MLTQHWGVLWAKLQRNMRRWCQLSSHVCIICISLTWASNIEVRHIYWIDVWYEFMKFWLFKCSWHWLTLSSSMTWMCQCLLVDTMSINVELLIWSSYWVIHKQVLLVSVCEYAPITLSKPVFGFKVYFSRKQNIFGLYHLSYRNGWATDIFLIWNHLPKFLGKLNNLDFGCMLSKDLSAAFYWVSLQIIGIFLFLVNLCFEPFKNPSSLMK